MGLSAKQLKALLRASKRKQLTTLFGIAFSGYCIYLLFSEIQFGQLIETLKTVNVAYCGLAFITIGLSYVVRGIRWPYFFSEEKVSFKTSYKLVILGFFMNNVLPARMGELVRSHFGGKMIGCSRATVLATVAGERLFDSLAISSFFLFGYYFLGLGTNEALGELKYPVHLLAVASAVFFAVGFVTLLSLKAEKIVLAISGWGQTKFSGTKAIKLLLEKLEQFYLSLKPMFEIKRLLVISFFSFMVWSLETMSFVVVCLAFDVLPKADMSLLYLGAGAFSSLAPAAPGGVGVIEGAVTYFLSGYGILPALALSMAVVTHTAQILVVGIQGVLVLAFGGLGKEGGIDISPSPESSS